LGKEKIKWKVEYDYTYYKVYDNKGTLAGYFFPYYEGLDTDRDEDEKLIEKINKDHHQVSQGTLLVPMAKLDLLDKEDGIDIDYAISSLDANLSRTKFWKQWLVNNANLLSIHGARVYTAREDRNMLSIAIGISGKITLGEKELKEFIAPLLDRLHEDGLL
jgi:hypothetical protein